MLCPRRADNLDSCLLIWICSLWNSSSVNRISFCFKNCQSLIQFLFTNIKLQVNIRADIDHTFFVNLLFNEVSSFSSFLHSRFGFGIKQRTNSRLANLLSKLFSKLSSNLSGSHSFFVSESLRSLDFKHTTFIFSQSFLSSILSGCQSKLFLDIFRSLCPTLFLKFLNTTKKIAAMLIRVFSRSPWISSRSSFNAIVFKSIRIALEYGSHFFYDCIHGLNPPIDQLLRVIYQDVQSCS